MTIVAVHQPNFFPWLGYFSKIRRADVFVFLNDAQYPKTGGTWLNRAKIVINGEPRWLSVPVDRAYSGTRPIDQVQFAQGNWRSNVLKTLQTSYGRAAFYQETADLLFPFIQNSEESVAAYNVRAISEIAKALHIETPLVVSSHLNITETATDRLVGITKAVGCRAYLSGGGSAGYQEEALFRQAGIELIYQNYVHPFYAQPRSQEFVPGLSIIDALMHIGISGTSKLLTTGSFV